MGAYKNKGSLIYQVKSRFRELDATGQKKALDPNNEYIHSFGTMKTYLKHSLDFATYCRSTYGCKTIEDCRPYVKEFIEQNNYSPWVKKTQRSAIAKLYGVKSKEFGDIDTGNRSRATIKRSRGGAVREKHFSETGKYSDYVSFCKGTGLRKSEMENLRGSSFYRDETGQAFLRVTKGTKGGRIRAVPILEEYVNLVENTCLKAGTGKVIPFIADDRLKAPSGANTHGYRAEYAKQLYDELKRPLDIVPMNERYYCRGDLKGVIYDKNAMEIVSNALGHTRISIIASSYLHGGR